MALPCMLLQSWVASQPWWGGISWGELGPGRARGVDIMGVVINVVVRKKVRRLGFGIRCVVGVDWWVGKG